MPQNGFKIHFVNNSLAIIDFVNETVIQNFIINLQRLRKRYGCSSKQLSELIGCDSSYISKVENGRIIPSLDKIIAIANYFKIEFVDMFRG